MDVRERVYRVSGGLARLELGLATLGLVCVVSAVLVQAAARYLFELGLAWPSEVSRYLYIWSSFLGGAAAVHYKEEIKVDVLAPLLDQLGLGQKDLIRTQVQRVAAFLSACFMTLLAYLVWGYVAHEVDAGLKSQILGVPMWTVSLALLVAAVSSVFHYLAVALNEPLPDEMLSGATTDSGTV